MKILKYIVLTVVLIGLVACGGSGESKDSVDFSKAFITKWKVTESDKSITIPTKGRGYNYTVDWGDGSVEKNLTKQSKHTYKTKGLYSIKIIGNFPRIYFKQTPAFYGTGNALKLVAVNQWGENQWSSMSGAFYSCKNLQITATDTPDLSKVIDMSYMFYNYSYAEEETTRGTFRGNLSTWDVSHITNMSYMFSGSPFSGDISEWDVSNVTNMSNMFILTNKFNSNISNWDVSNVTNMKQMFTCARAFDQALGGWDVSNVTNMDKFLASSYDGEGKNEWCDTNLSVINYDNLLHGWSKLEFTNHAFLSLDVGDTKYINSASKVREELSSKLNLPIADGAKVEIVNGDYSSSFIKGEIVTLLSSEIIPHDRDNVSYKWKDGENFLSNDANFTTNSLTLGEHNISLTVTNKYGVWARDLINIKIVDQYKGNLKPFITEWKKTNHIDIHVYNTSYKYNYIIDWGDGKADYNVTGDISHEYDSVGSHRVEIVGNFPTFYNTENYENSPSISVLQWGDIQWQSMSSTFRAYGLVELNATDRPNLSKVISVSRMFGATDFNQDISNWDFSNITDMSWMFWFNYEFNQDISSWDTSNVLDMSYMFKNTPNFNQDMSFFNVSSVKDMRGMFQTAQSFNQDISSWDVSNVTNMDEMFSTESCDSFPEDDICIFDGISSFDQDLGDWNVSNVQSMRDMFFGVTLSTKNYNSLLNGWSKLELQKNVVFDGGNSQYSVEAKEAREKMINEFGWTITDNGVLE